MTQPVLCPCQACLDRREAYALAVAESWAATRSPDGPGDQLDGVPPHSASDFAAPASPAPESP